jgi:hypothetical protein
MSTPAPVATKSVRPSNSYLRSQFEAYWDRPLRRPLFDAPPPAPKHVEKKPLPPIRAKLLATMIESEDSTAILKLGRGEVVFRKVGEAIGEEDSDAKVAKIEPSFVVVRRGDGETRLTIDGTKRN